MSVDSDEETVRLLQEGHGGWAEGMREVRPPMMMHIFNGIYRHNTVEYKTWTF